MVREKYSLTPKQQTRLHSLMNSGGKVPNSYDVPSDAEEMFIDISSLSWDDDAFTSFFEYIEFQDKLLTYSLAVRDDSKQLDINRESSVPLEIAVLSSIKERIKDEFGDSAFAESKNTVAVSSAIRENLKGILITSNKCKYLGIIVYLVPIGRKLNIQFYTLLMPVEKNNNQIFQQALSLKNNISPSAIMWEKSLKQSTLVAIQYLLNRETYSSIVEQNNSENINTSKNDEVLF